VLPRRPTGVLCCGNIVMDILVRPVDQIRWGATTWVEAVEQHLGGNGANTSYTLAKLGVPVRLIGRVGGDPFGDYVLGRLTAAGVNLEAVARTTAPTATTVALVDAQGARAFLHRPGASQELEAPMDFPACGPSPHFHLANLFALPQLRRQAPESLRRARADGYTTSLDTGWDALDEWLAVIEPCLPLVDLLFVNQDEARMLASTEDPERAADFLHRLGAARVVVKLGAEGCLVCGGFDRFRSPAFQVPVVDTTGAGDCFVGAFLAGLHHGATPEEAARLANAAGALSIQSLGAVEGLRSYQDTLEWIRIH